MKYIGMYTIIKEYADDVGIGYIESVTDKECEIFIFMDDAQHVLCVSTDGMRNTYYIDNKSNILSGLSKYKSHLGRCMFMQELETLGYVKDLNKYNTKCVIRDTNHMKDSKTKKNLNDETICKLKCIYDDAMVLRIQNIINLIYDNTPSHCPFQITILQDRTIHIYIAVEDSICCMEIDANKYYGYEVPDITSFLKSSTRYEYILYNSHKEIVYSKYKSISLLDYMILLSAFKKLELI